ncbi:Stomatin-like protein 1 [Lamellibrachia satsuma]|nr:Stomatin-like protein 1 [Lamellibrachia satsuma]
MNFESIHLYDSVQDYSSNSSVEAKYSSIFKYGNPVTVSRTGGTHDVTHTSLLSRYCEALVIFTAYLVFFLTLPLSGWFSIKTLHGHERMVVFRLGRLLPAKGPGMLQTLHGHERIVVFRLGRLLPAKGPGMILVLPLIDRATKVDLRTKAFSVPPQKVLTTDGGIIEVGADVYYNVQDVILSVSNVQDLNHSTRIISQTLLQKQLGRYDLDELETKKANICELLQNDINQMSLTWGVKVGRIELSPIKILQPPDPTFSQHGNAVQMISSILFPSGTKEIPIQTALQQMGQFLQAGESKPSAESAVPEVKSPQDLLNIMKPLLNHSLVEQFDCVYCFRITGSPGTEADVYFLDLKHGEGQVGCGSPPSGTTGRDLDHVCG